MNDSGSSVVVLGPDDGHRAGDVPSRYATVCATRAGFPDGEQLVTLPRPALLRGRHVLLVHTTAKPQDQRLVSLCQLADVVAHAGPLSLTCFVPYLCYQRQDRRVNDGEPLSAALPLRMLAAFGVEALMTVDKHSGRPAVPDAPRIVNLDIAADIVDTVRRLGIAPDIVVAPDTGGLDRASRVAGLLGLPAVALDKSKDADRGTFYRALPAALRGRDCLVVEDVCSSGSTLQPLCAALAAVGARVTVAVTHLLASASVVLEKLPTVAAILYSDSCGTENAPIKVLTPAVAYWSGTTGPGRTTAPAFTKHNA